MARATNDAIQIASLQCFKQNQWFSYGDGFLVDHTFLLAVLILLCARDRVLFFLTLAFDQPLLFSFVANTEQCDLADSNVCQ